MNIKANCPGCNRLTTRKPVFRKLASGQWAQIVECKHCGDVSVLRCFTQTEYEQLQRGKRRMRLIRRAARKRATLGAK